MCETDLQCRAVIFMANDARRSHDGSQRAGLEHDSERVEPMRMEPHERDPE